MRLESARFIAESYFEFYNEHGASVATSKKLFSKLPGRPNNPQLASLLNSPPVLAPEHDRAVRQIHATIFQHLVPQWLLQLEAGSNLALYGYGSKATLLDDFVVAGVQDGWFVFRLRCYKREDSFIRLLQTIIQELGGPTRAAAATSRRLSELTDTVCALSHRMVLVIEMADAPSMRNGETYRALAALAAGADNIRLVLTFEHMNSLLLANDKRWSSLSLAWHDATTLRPYTEELSILLMLDQKSMMMDGETRREGARFVLASLTKTGRSVFRVLAEHQLGGGSSVSAPPLRRIPDSEDELEEEDYESPGAKGMSVVAWYQKCQEQFLVSNEIAFRTQLTELVDHELIRAVDDSGQNGSEFFIPFERAHIEALLADL